MLPLHYPRYWHAASLALLLSVLAFALVPTLWFWPDSNNLSWNLSDKWLHAITFALLAIWFAGQYAQRSYWKLAIGLAAFGALIELCQYAVPYRSAQMGDMLADLVGIASGVAIAMLGAGGWSLHIERWLARQID